VAVNLKQASLKLTSAKGQQQQQQQRAPLLLFQAVLRIRIFGSAGSAGFCASWIRIRIH
jgi:hypothetical protein